MYPGASSPLRSTEREERRDFLLHSIRKPPPKPWRKPAASPSQPATKVYVVDPPGFRQLVQKLTGVSESSSAQRRLGRSAPPPLNLLPPSSRQLAQEIERKPLPPSPRLQLFLSSEQPKKCNENSSPIGFLSPSSYSSLLCSFPLPSPGTMALLDQSTVL